jgi:hypothetical protein
LKGQQQKAFNRKVREDSAKITKIRNGPQKKLHGISCPKAALLCGLGDAFACFAVKVFNSVIPNWN